MSSSSSTASRCRKNCRKELRRELDEFVGVDDDRPDDEELNGELQNKFLVVDAFLFCSIYLSF